jgi:cation-transporting ATPase E
VEPHTVDVTQGLTAAQVAQRVAAGRTNAAPPTAIRTVGEIVRANVLTRFNLLLGVLLVAILLVAPIQDALFGLVMVVNSAIGIVQELRARRTLQRLALLSAPRARVVRDGRVLEVPVDQVVADDVVRLEPGDQVVVDGDVLATRGLEVDESLLTGESDAVRKAPGDRCRSGSFVVAGSGTQWAQGVGAEAYATQLAARAREFRMVDSDLRRGVDWLLRAISWLLVPTLALVLWSQLTTQELGYRQAIASSVAGVVGVVPQGLVLLTSMAFAVAVLRLGRRRVVVQELPAVEGLARVDTVCLDKTGTLTTGQLVVHEVQPLGTDRRVDVEEVLGAMAAADPTPNATLRAIAEAYPERPDWEVSALTPFSSARKLSAAAFGDHGTWVLGAPEVLLEAGHPVLARAQGVAARGQRVLLVASTPRPVPDDAPPADLAPAALVVLGDQLRPDAADTIAWFVAQSVVPKVISGDHPGTVAAIAAGAGVPDADRAVDARDLPTDAEALADAMAANAVFGRVTPEQKHAMVEALQARGHVVAMTGDGVNDVLALKAADLGVAMGSGSPASRAVAQVVLLDSTFATMPAIVAEGRQVIANIERVANLFVTKTVYAFLLALAVGAAGIAFPFLPRHLTLVGALTIGIPGFFLAMEPTARPYRPGFLPRVLRFALPTGAVAAAATFSAYWLARDETTTLAQSRTTATLVLGALGIFALVLVCRPPSRLRRALVAGVTVAFLAVFAIPVTRTFFALQLPRPVVLLAAVGIVAVTGAAMYATLRIAGWLRQVDLVGVTTAAVAETGRALSGALHGGHAPPRHERDEPS